MNTRHDSLPYHLKPKEVYFAWLGILLLWLASLTSCSLMREQIPTQTPATNSPLRVTPDQIARAMQEDHFYSDYGQNQLLVQGTISSLDRQNNDLTITLSTTVATAVLCDLGNLGASLKPGEAITVTARADQALRQPSAVMLKNCSIR
jgi:hypothetical protein